MSNKWILLDRDGVINKDSPDYIKSEDEFEFLPGALEAIEKLTHADYSIVIITNQSGVGRGLYSQNTLNNIHKKMFSEIEDSGGMIIDIFFCPHHPDDNCECRKPKPGMLLDFAKKYQVDLNKNTVYFIGDTQRDVEAAVAANCTPIFIGKSDNDLNFDNLLQAATYILEEENNNNDEDII